MTILSLSRTNPIVFIRTLINRLLNIKGRYLNK